MMMKILVCIEVYLAPCKALKIREESKYPDYYPFTAKTEDTDKIFGLNVEPDDYVTKPFNSLELVARVKSQAASLYKVGDNDAGTDIKCLQNRWSGDQ